MKFTAKVDATGMGHVFIDDTDISDEVVEFKVHSKLNQMNSVTVTLFGPDLDVEVDNTTISQERVE